MTPPTNSQKTDEPPGPTFALILGVLGTILLVVGRVIGSAFRGMGDGSGAYTPTFESTWFSALLTVGILVLNAYAIFNTKKILIRIIAGVTLLLSAPITLSALGQCCQGIVTSFKVHAYEKELNRRKNWAAMGRDLTPVLLNYILKHPQTVHPTGKGEYIKVDGFTDYAGKQTQAWSSKKGKFSTHGATLWATAWTVTTTDGYKATSGMATVAGMKTATKSP